jgi:benzylsuccinate CoA-transferase BbsF subunit
VFPCAGEDRWCAIAVRDESEWRRFCECIEAPGLADDARFASLPARKQNEDALESIVAGWTATMAPEEVQERLQACGVAAGRVARPEDLFSDPQFAHRRQFVPLEHPELGLHQVITSPFRLSGADNFPVAPAPLLGQHTDLICREFLGMSDAEIAQMASEGVFE